MGMDSIRAAPVLIIYGEQVDTDNNLSASATIDQWWVAGPSGTTQGPYDFAVLEGLVLSGALAPRTQVCRKGELTWQPLSAVRGPYQGDSMVPPPPPAFTSATAGPGLARSVPTGPAVKPLSVAVSVLLTVATLGIWMLVWAFEAMHGYRRLSGRSGTDLNALYWGAVGAVIATFVLSFLFLPLGFLAAIGATVVLAVLLNEMLIDRDTAAAQLGIPGALHSRATILGLYIASNVLALTLIGLIAAIPMSLVYLAIFFGDHNRIAQAAVNAPTQVA